MRRPTSCIKDIASVPTPPSVTTAIKKKLYVDYKDEYLQIFRFSASQATLEGPRTARFKKLAVSVWLHVKSHNKHLPLAQGIKVRPSGRLPSLRQIIKIV